MFKVIIAIAVLIATIFVTIFCLLPLLFVPILSSTLSLHFIILIVHFIWFYFFSFLVIFFFIARYDVLGKRNCYNKALSGTVMRCWGGEALCSPRVGSLFWTSQVFLSPPHLRWESIASMGRNWVFPLSLTRVPVWTCSIHAQSLLCYDHALTANEGSF